MFDIEFSRQAISFLKKADKTLAERILSKIELLKTEPVGHDAKRIVGMEKVFRVRVGDYRILYTLSWDLRKILVHKIDKRARVYK